MSVSAFSDVEAESSPDDDEITQPSKKARTSFDETKQKPIDREITLICKGRIFTASEAFLSKYCYFFHKFYNDSTGQMQQEIVLDDWEPEGVAVFLDNFSTGTLAEVEFQNLGSVLKGLHLVGMTAAYDHYKKIFLDQLSCSNYLEYWKVAESVKDRQILQAVYSLVPNIYITDEFQKTNLAWLIEFLDYLKGEETTTPFLLLQIIGRWINSFKHSRLHNLHELLETVTFSKLSDSHLIEIIKDPLFRQLEIVMNKTLDVASERLPFKESMERANVYYLSMTLIGSDQNNQIQIQKCKTGQWMNDTSFEGYCNQVFSNSNLDFLVKDINGKLTLHRLQLERKVVYLGKVPTNATVIMEHSASCTAVIGYRPTEEIFTFITCFQNNDEIIYKSLKLKSVTDMIEYRMYLLSNQNELFMVAVAQLANHQLRILIHEHNLGRNRWKQVQSFRVDENSVRIPCFMEMTETQIVIRFFPGRSYYFCLSSGKITGKVEDNNIQGIVSLKILNNTAWCLDNDGLIFMQDLESSKPLWRYLSRAPNPLRNYQKLMFL